MRLRALALDIDYAGHGETILSRFVLPALGVSSQYDRVTSFFSTGSLLAIAEGLDSLRASGGRMRLVLGIHDVPADLARAATLGVDPVNEVISGVRARIIAEISTIRDEMMTRRLETLAWMLQDGLLSVRVAAPKLVSPGPPGLFHSKLFIFKDSYGDVVAAAGSPNETGAGLGSNIEHLIVFSSWDQPQYAERQVSYFETLWLGEREDVVVRELDEAFAKDVLAALRPSHRLEVVSSVSEPTLQSVLELASRMAPYALLSGGHTALYPHQERAVLDALSRWPVRVMLADEVGLGKTFETGAVLKYLLTHTACRRVLILVPKAVLRQWQDELSEHFGIDAWMFDSGRREFISRDGTSRPLAPGEPVLGSSAPAILLMSAQYARGTRNGGHVGMDATRYPDVLVVDEAHSARVRPDLSGVVRPTLMWRMLDDIMRHIPHVIFATATPMQVHWQEYHALLKLLGLPEAWEDAAAYEQSLRLISEAGHASMQDAARLSALVCATVNEMRPALGHLDTDEQSLLARLLSNDDAVDRALIAQGEWSVGVRLLTKLHPGHLLTVRNTRAALESVGYRFPTRSLHAPALQFSREVKEFYATVDKYISDVYFDVERLLAPDRKFNVGFVKCGFQQRLASSLESCRLSLSRRRDRIAQLGDAAPTSESLRNEWDDISDSEAVEDADLFESIDTSPRFANASQVRHAVRVELQWLNDLVGMVDALLDGAQDPKIATTLTLISEHLARGESVLVFSRYTDTLDAVIASYREGIAETAPASFGIYTGQTVALDLGGGAQRATRKAITEALADGVVKVVFCSEAASEGLNLQAARVLINVDVPWNPARLEQRIGRIARLGQRSSSVDVYNLWYPESVEARMYQRLMDRRDLFELAVGEFPEVVSAAIRDEVAARYGNPSPTTDPLSTLNALRHEVQHRALRRLWARDASGVTLARRFRDGLGDLVGQAVTAIGGQVTRSGDVVRIQVANETEAFSVEPGSPSVLSLSHPATRFLGRHKMLALPEVRVFVHDGIPALFGLQSETDWRPVSPIALPALLARLGSLVVPQGSDARIDFVVQEVEPSIALTPNFADLKVPSRLECNLPSRPTFRVAEMSLATIQHCIER